MYSNLSKNSLLNSQLSFLEYIANSKELIKKRRPDLSQQNPKTTSILDANSPFELHPSQGAMSKNRLKYGALLIHGLLDCPFSLKDIALRMQANGILCRAILLPGHGTTPSELLTISYQDWVQLVRYGIESLKNEVDQIFLIGYSTGAALSIYHALQDATISGLILLSPAIQLKTSVDMLMGFRFLTNWLTNNHQWVCCEEEIDYAKYLSIPVNAVSQVVSLTAVIKNLHQSQPLSCPTLMMVSRDDETISSEHAIQFFSSLKNKKDRLILYATQTRSSHADSRIIKRNACYPDLFINNFSHMSLLFTPNNLHYGQHGDYTNAAHLAKTEVLFGAYNRLESRMYDYLRKMKVIKNQRKELTYNPDFDFMANEIVEFIKNG